MADLRDIGMNAAGSSGNSQSTSAGTGATQGNSKDIDEARIVDEVVIKPPSASAPAPAPAPEPARPAPPHISPPSPAPIPPTVPRAAPSAPPTSPPSIARDSLDEKPLPQTSTQPPLEEKKVVSSPAPPPPTSPQDQTPASTSHPEDFQKILKEVKLPERPVSHEAALPKQQIQYDTTLASPLTPSQHKETDQSLPTPPQAETPFKTDLKSVSSEHPSSIVAPVHTLKNDFQDIVREKKMSLVRAAALEQDKRRSPGEKYDVAGSVRKRHTFGIVFASVILALLGTAAFFGVALVMQERSGVATQQEAPSLLFAESSVPLPIENLASFDIKRLLAQARLSSNTLGSILRIIPTMSATSGETPAERPAALEEFLKAIDARATPELVRALGSEFFFGLHTVDENAPVLIIPVVSYERAFAGMLAWEKTLNADLAPVFTSVPPTVLGESGLLEERAFKDIVMRNYDVRALTDDAGTIQLYYSFPTRGLLIIAESPYSFAEILARLRAERRL